MDDKVVVITGAFGGLGPSVIAAFAQAQARLALADRNLERADSVLRPLALEPKRVLVRAVDLLDEREARQWAEAVLAHFGRVDAVLHLVGGWRGGGAIEDFPAEDWQWLNDALVQTTWHVIRAFAPALKAHRGRFVMISSTQAQRPSYGNAAYAAGKAAAEALTLALADELAPYGGSANIIVVKGILTPSMRAERPEELFAELTPAEDIAQALLFLCSDAARKMNGQRLYLC
ncbi:MAG: SDR family oxidoreductase [Thermoflexales bacterium]|nr:SDR family oxidoreductase [Thermoflexales bacterium]MCS7324979.1 SDR family oxidoreductase [Thermoflexales bacterium]MCX7939233.1 SDR family oxidoreductase [Thermoflexales bacterium]MDW8053879.1 SDR family oxidoreductase [Anaerolineae bacterium]MDW8292410.1 SDR family oxidoreductase [Anaerolineae bacterium]